MAATIITSQHHTATKATTVNSYFPTRSVAAVTLFRIGLALVLPQLQQLTTVTGGYAAVTVNPVSTLRHLREGQFFLQYCAAGSVGHYASYTCLTNGDAFHHSSLLMVVLEPPVFMLSHLISSIISSTDEDDSIAREREYLWQQIMFALLFLLMDFAVAYSLMDLSRTILTSQPQLQPGKNQQEASNNSDNSNAATWESQEVQLEHQMEGRIRPIFGWLFGIPSHSLHKDCNTFVPPKNEDDDDDGENTSTNNNETNVESILIASTSQCIQKDKKSTEEKSHEFGGVQAKIPPSTSNAANGTANTTRTTTTTIPLKSQHVTLSSPCQQSQHMLPLVPLDSSTIPPFLFLLYYANPISIVAVHVFFSFRSLSYLFYLSSIRHAYMENNNVPLATFFLAVATFLDINPIMFLVPIVAMVWRRRRRSTTSVRSTAMVCLGFFSVWLGFLFYLSYILMDGHSNNLHHFRHKLGYHDLSPNLGMVWYFFVQMFTKFRGYFVFVFNGIPFLFVIPISVKLWRYPMEIATSLLLITHFFGAVITLQDTVFVLATLLLTPRTLARMGLSKIVIVTLLASVVPLALFVLDFWLYLDTGSGNSNYMFFQGLVFCVFIGMILVDFVMATVFRDKALRLTEKQLLMNVTINSVCNGVENKEGRAHATLLATREQSSNSVSSNSK